MQVSGVEVPRMEIYAHIIGILMSRFGPEMDLIYLAKTTPAEGAFLSYCGTVYDSQNVKYDIAVDAEELQERKSNFPIFAPHQQFINIDMILTTDKCQVQDRYNPN